MVDHLSLGPKIDENTGLRIVELKAHLNGCSMLVPLIILVKQLMKLIFESWVGHLLDAKLRDNRPERVQLMKKVQSNPYRRLYLQVVMWTPTLLYRFLWWDNEMLQLSILSQLPFLGLALWVLFRVVVGDAHLLTGVLILCELSDYVAPCVVSEEYLWNAPLFHLFAIVFII